MINYFININKKNATDIDPKIHLKTLDVMLKMALIETENAVISVPKERISVERAMHLLKDEEEEKVVEYTYKMKKYLLRFNERKSCFEKYSLHKKNKKWRKIDYSYLDLQALKMGYWIYTNDYYFKNINEK